MSLPFIKMHGNGNDFIMLDAIKHPMPKDLSAFSRKICDRRFGIGADQVLIAYPSKTADFRMDIYNSDGGQVEMCGNGIRCFLSYVRDQGHTQKKDITVETLAGIIKPVLISDHPQTTKNISWVRVDMGEPVLEGSKIPVKQSGKIVSQNFEVIGFPPVKITCVSMGNPHCVIFVDDVEKFPVEQMGPLIENDAFFPKRVNVEFVQVMNRGHLIQRTWERGAGETYACGTGACAVVVAAVLNDVTDRQVRVSLKGGDLDLLWDEKLGRVFKTGPATKVFSGVIDEKF